MTLVIEGGGVGWSIGLVLGGVSQGCLRDFVSEGLVAVLHGWLGSLLVLGDAAGLGVGLLIWSLVVIGGMFVFGRDWLGWRLIIICWLGVFWSRWLLVTSRSLVLWRNRLVIFVRLLVSRFRLVICFRHFYSRIGALPFWLLVQLRSQLSCGNWPYPPPERRDVTTTWARDKPVTPDTTSWASVGP